MEEKTNMEKWELAQSRSLDRALEAEVGSDEEKQSLKQASEIQAIINEDAKRENEKKETRRRMIWDGVKFVLGGIGMFAAKVYLLDRADQHDKENMRELIRAEQGTDENDPIIFSTTAGKQTKNLFFRKR